MHKAGAGVVGKKKCCANCWLVEATGDDATSPTLVAKKGNASWLSTQALTSRSTHPTTMSTQAGSLYHCALEAKPVPAVVPARAFVPLPASAFPFYSTEYKYHSPSLIRVMSTDPIRSTIEQDKEEHPHCSYSTLRSHFSSFLNGSSKAETLTKIIRVCEGA